jgi:multidrug efflux system outer membrane protein
MKTVTTFRVLALAMAGTLLAACAVPGRIRQPEGMRSDVPLAGLTSAKATGKWPDPRWWKRYHDTQLNQLIDSALKGATSLATARSRVQEATAAAKVTADQVGLRINGNAQFTRQRLSENGLIPTSVLGFTWYNQGDLGIQGSYDFDLWGGHRAAVQAAIGQIRAAQAGRSAAALALEVQITRTYFGWLADQQRLELARMAVQQQEKLAHVLDLRVMAGIDPSDHWQQARSAAAASRQKLEALRGSARIRQAVLAALVGVSPKDLPRLKPRPLPKAHASVPAHARLDLVARRPDIAARRWQVEAALRRTDVARAKFFPDLSINALAGFSSIDLGKLTAPASRVFSVTPALHLPIFESGLLHAAYGLSRAQLETAVAQYNDAVINAARQVATQVLDLERLRAQSAQQQQQLQAVASLERSASARRRQGVTNIVPLLQARLQLLTQRDALLQLHAQTLDADIGLIQALGGGYRMHGNPSADAATPAPASSSSSLRKPRS